MVQCAVTMGGMARDGMMRDGSVVQRGAVVWRDDGMVGDVVPGDVVPDDVASDDVMSDDTWRGGRGHHAQRTGACVRRMSVVMKDVVRWGMGGGRAGRGW